ncbi:MAG TPA: sulfotransferase domain-containing protein [Terriglobia bacterium]|jgi:hypothetical protein
MIWLLAILGVFVIQVIHLSIVLKWSDDRTTGLNYYGLPAAGRDRFKRRLRFHAAILRPILWLNTRSGKLDFRKARIVYKGISAPTGSCSLETFAKAEAYLPRPEDVFVVTQMRCGTTWMQHIVYQVLYRGNGDLVETGRELYAVSPWLEGRRSVPIEQAPLLGIDRPSRLIKTHLPVRLCPFSPASRYIYVGRHPAACFASCIDFLATNLGAMTPGLPQFEEWFTSPDLMWWGTWTDHLNGWRDRARKEPNVLFVTFEEMQGEAQARQRAASINGLPAIIQRVAAFLDLPLLTGPELENAVYKTGFKYMQEHQDNFEMQPPHLFQPSAKLFVSGSGERRLDVPEEVRIRIEAWARKTTDY